MGRRKVINLLNALTIPTFIAGFYIEEWISLNLVTGEKWLLLILLIVFVVVVALIINSIFTRKISFNKQKISIAVVGVSSFLIVTVIAITGGLGYEKRIPDSDDIDTMHIDFSFDIIEAASGDYELMGGDYDFIKCGISSGIESISFSDKKDLEKGKWVKVSGFKDSKVAKQKILEAANNLGSLTKEKAAKIGNITKKAAITVADNVKEGSEQLGEKLGQLKYENDKRKFCPIYKEDVLDSINIVMSK